MDELKAHLKQAGIDITTLTTLRDVAVSHDTDLSTIPPSSIEDQYPLYTLATSTEDAFALWEQLKPVLAPIGHYPILLGNKQSISLLWQGREWAETPEHYLKASRRCDAKQWFDDKYAHFFDYDDTQTEASILGEWEDAKPMTTFDATKLYWRKKPMQYIGLFPTTISWQTPAYIAYGNWNACPTADIQACVLRYWQEHYGIEVIALVSDQLVCRVAQPVTTQAAALELAKQQMVYCEDSVFQGVGSLRGLASALLNSTYWLFWWD